MLLHGYQLMGRGVILSVISLTLTEEEVNSHQGPGLPPLTETQIASAIHRGHLRIEDLNLTEEQRNSILNELQFRANLRRRIIIGLSMLGFGVILYLILGDDIIEMPNLWVHFSELDARDQAQIIKPILSASQNIIIRRLNPDI